MQAGCSSHSPRLDKTLLEWGSAATSLVYHTWPLDTSLTSSPAHEHLICFAPYVSLSQGLFLYSSFVLIIPLTFYNWVVHASISFLHSSSQLRGHFSLPERTSLTISVKIAHLPWNPMLTVSLTCFTSFSATHHLLAYIPVFTFCSSSLPASSLCTEPGCTLNNRRVACFQQIVFHEGMKASDTVPGSAGVVSKIMGRRCLHGICCLGGEGK